ncbi:hypothetical protein P3T43_006836, partial [Paraburkholderia sp. GAS41]
MHWSRLDIRPVKYSFPSYNRLIRYSHEILCGSFENCVGNAAHEACGLKLEKSSLPAMRKSTV